MRRNTLGTVIQTVDIQRNYPEWEHYLEDSDNDLLAPTQQDSHSAMTAFPGGMLSSLQKATSTTEGESSLTDAAGVAGDGVFSPSSEPDEIGECYSRCPVIYRAQKRATTLSPKSQHGPRWWQQTQPWSSHRPWGIMARLQLLDGTLPTLIVPGGVALVGLGPCQNKNRVVPRW